LRAFATPSFGIYPINGHCWDSLQNQEKRFFDADADRLLVSRKRHTQQREKWLPIIVPVA
jgi:hypothetical protein